MNHSIVSIEQDNLGRFSRATGHIANFGTKIPGSITYRAVITTPQLADSSMPTSLFLQVKASWAITCLPTAPTIPLWAAIHAAPAYTAGIFGMIVKSAQIKLWETILMKLWMYWFTAQLTHFWVLPLLYSVHCTIIETS